jgi:hypothetical protein
VPAELAPGAARLAEVARLGSPGGPRGDLPPPQHDPEQARQAADDILSQDRYQWADDRSLLERVGDWIADRIGDIVSPFGFGAGGVPVWVGWLVLAALVAGAGYMIYRARGGWRRDRVGDRDSGGRVVVAAGEEAIDWAAEVVRCEAEGRWREALRARYRVLVADLARRGVLGDLVGRTAGELVAEVRHTAPAAATAFAAATAIFEAAWYGGARVGPAERDRFGSLADEVRATAGRRSTPPRVRA